MQATDHAPRASTSSMGAFVTMLYEPTATFQRLEPKPKGWMPMLALMATTAILTLWYFSMVDFAWLLEQMADAMKSAQEREQAAKVMSKYFLQVSYLISALVVFPLIFLISAIYLLLASKALGYGLTFGKAFALATWSSVPSLLLLPLGAIQILMSSSGQLGFSELNPLSLNQLVLHYDLAHPFASMMESVNVTSIWSIVVLIIGFETWARAKRATAVTVVLIPYILIYGLWCAYAVSKTA